VILTLASTKPLESGTADMYDRLLKLLAEADAQGQKSIFDVIKTKDAVKKARAKGITSGKKGATAAQKKASKYFGQKSTHLNTSGT